MCRANFCIGGGKVNSVVLITVAELLHDALLVDHVRPDRIGEQVLQKVLHFPLEVYLRHFSLLHPLLGAARNELHELSEVHLAVRASLSGVLLVEHGLFGEGEGVLDVETGEFETHGLAHQILTVCLSDRIT